MRFGRVIGIAALGTVLGAWTSCSPAPEPETASPAPEDVPVEVFLPLGDPERGREAFLDLQCHACHYLDESTPRPVATRPGPDFGPHLANRTRDELARSIITPSAHNSERDQEFLDSAVSRMGDLTNVITIRQLVDMVAYLQSL